MKQDQHELRQQVINTEPNPLVNQNKIDLRSISFKLSDKVQEECVISLIYAVYQPLWLLLLEVFSCLITGGILLIVYSWFKDLRFRLFFLITTMKKAKKVVVFGPDKDVQIISLCYPKATDWNSVIPTESNHNQNINIPDQTQQLHTTKEAIQAKKNTIFTYRFNKYQYKEGEFIPYGYFSSNFQNDDLINKFKDGLNQEQLKNSKDRNGENTTDTPDRGLLIVIFEEVFSPFYLFQIGSTILWLFEGYRIYAYIILGTSTISLILKIYELRSNFLRLKKFSYFRSKCEAIREGKIISIQSNDIGFGENLIIKEGEIASCDLIITQGSVIVNESMLTGESIPIVKTALESNKEIFLENKQNVIFCGSLIQQVSKNTECHVIRVGFETLKGNLIRSIMYPKHHSQISFDNDSGKFILILASVALISFLASIKTFLDKYDLGYIEKEDVIIRLLDLVTISVPPALPTCLSFGISFSLSRLKKRSIYCINPQKINICGIVRTICFDKTGTLTEEKLSFKLVSAFEKNEFKEQSSSSEFGKMQKVIMSSCQSLMKFQGKNAGDPLDIEMFESTGADILPENTSPEKQMVNSNPVISEISLNGNLSDKSEQNIIKILKRFQFESEVERMSSIISFGNECFVVTKGSPEKLKQICKPDSIPGNFNQILSNYTQEGYRVISLSYKPIQISGQFSENERNFYENQLIFAGFLVFENKLKPETKPHIDLLQKNKVQIHMVTGDNPLTSLSVAKQCNILTSEYQIQVLDIVDQGGLVKCTLNSKESSMEEISQLLMTGNNQFVMTGTFFEKFLIPLKQQNSTYLPFLLCLTKVYARMKPDQKQSLVRLLQSNQNVSSNYSFIGMCGDGANDCQALKDADMGISLGEAEASIAASFTSKVVNISVIEYILREGRCCLATSFQCFKFMSLYSIIQCSTTGILYQRGAIPGDYQFLYWDLFIIIPLAFAIGLTDASSNLTVSTPTHRLFSHTNIFSVIGMGIIQFIFLLISIASMSSQDWYLSPEDIVSVGGQDPSSILADTYDNAVLFWLSNFQYIFSVIAFSIGSQHKKPFYSNLPFTVFLVSIIGLSIYSLFSQDDDFTIFFNIQAIASDLDGNQISEMPYWWRWIVAIIIVVNILVNIIYEKYIVNIMNRAFERLFPNYIYQGVFNGTFKSSQPNNSEKQLRGPPQQNIPIPQNTELEQMN